MLKESYYHDTSGPLTTLTLNEIIQETCDKYADRSITWVKPYEKLTYKEFYLKVQTLANGLRAIGLKKGDAFCSFGSQGSDSVVLMLACASLGLKYTATNLYSPVSRVMRMMVTKIKPSAVLVGNCTTGKRQEHVCTEFIKLLDEFTKEGSHGISHIIYDRKAEVDPNCELLDGWKSFSGVMELGKSFDKNENTASVKFDVTKDDPFIYLCSSGSTGEPKIVTIGQRAYANMITTRRPTQPTQPHVIGCNDVIEGDLKLIVGLFNSFAGGHSLVVLPANNSLDDSDVIREILSAVEKYRVKMLIQRTDYLMKIVDNPSYKAEYDISCLESLLLAGSLLSLEFKKKLLEVAPLSMDVYGGTEFAGSMNAIPLRMLPESKLNSIGKGRPNVELKIVDEKGTTVPPNTRGELCVRGWPLFLEYKGQPELTAKAIDKYGWYHTGDMISMDEDGYFYIYGRLSNAVRWKVNAKVVYSISVESVLIKHPSIRSATVIGTDNGRGHDLNYVIEPAPGSGLTCGDVKCFALENMYNSLEWPVRIFLYSQDQLPMTSGSRPKIHRRKLTEEITRRVTSNPSDGLV